MTEKITPPNKNAALGPTSDKNAAPGKTGANKSGHINWSLRILLILVVFLLGSGAGLYFLPVLKDRLPFVANWVQGDGASSAGLENSQLAERVTALEHRLEHRLGQQDAEIESLRMASSAEAPQSPQLAERLDRLEQAALQAEGQKETAKENMSQPDQAGRIDMLLARMSQLEASFIPLSRGLSDTQEARLQRAQLTENAAGQAEKLDQLGQRLDVVERYAARDNSGALLAFRIGELRRKVTSGADFGPEITALKAMTTRGSLAYNSRLNDAVSWLGQHSGGVTTRAKIRDQFDDLIPALIRAGSSHPDDPWWKRAYNSGKNLIMVRKTNDKEAEGLDGIIADAHQKLSQFDLNEALALLKQLPDNVRDALDVWIMRAEIYLQADQEMDRIESLAAAYYLDSEGGNSAVSEPEEQEEAPL